MEPIHIKRTKHSGPESVIQDAIMVMLKSYDWGVWSTHGNIYQYGFPDLYAAHFSYGTRWIEVKNPEAYSFTPAQLKRFPEMNSKGVNIWILTAATEDQYKRLFVEQNWYFYMNRSKLIT